MKRIVALPVFAILCGVSAALADPVEFVHPKVDKFSGECVVTSEGVTYRNMAYPSNPPTYYGGYVKFVAENEGDPVTVNFSEFNCLRGANPVVFVYDGEEALKTGFTSYSAPVPAGYIAALRPDDAGTDYVAESGVLCVLYAPASKSDFVTGSPSGSITGGYTAMVTAGIPSDMQFSAATAGNASSAAWRGARDVELLALSVRMDGTLNPLTMRRLAFDLSDVTSCGLVDNIRLYADNAASGDPVAALAPGATSLELTDRVLKGKNRFVVVADVKADANGSIPVPAVTALDIDGVERDVDMAGAAPLVVADEIHMATGGAHDVYTISGTTAFFDAGGPDGKIPVGTEGTVTFVPAPGAGKVQVDITSLKLFDTSSTGLNDVLRFYNGREADDAMLIAECLKDTKTIKSTAEDGSMTVSFRSLHGNESARKDGWEAQVSLFTPAPMTLLGVEAVPSGTSKAFAGEENVPLLLFNVKTNDQLNPFSISKISLSAADGSVADAIVSIRAYYLGESADTKNINSDRLFGAGTFGADGVAISGNRTLAEGDNWFAVTADFAGNMLSGTSAGIRLGAIAIGGADRQPEGETSATVTVDNTCVASKGSHTHAMYGDWIFKSPAPLYSYSTKYPEGTDDYVVTFVPTQPGAKAQLTFDDFDVYYASSSYGSKADFEVYNGRAVDASALLWKLSDNGQSKTGPGRRLRSEAEDGAIIIRFNPQASSSTYCGNGWTATVSQFVDHEAAVKSIAVNQESTGILLPGEENAPLLGITVDVEGSISPLELECIALELVGKGAVGRVNVLRAPAGGDMADALLWGYADVPAEGNMLRIRRAGDVESLPLHEEKNRFFVTADILPKVASDVAVDAKVLSLEFAGGKKYAVEEGDPEGVRLTKNIYILEAGDGHVKEVELPMMFYDDGGPDGNVSRNFEGTVTFVPAAAGTTLQLNAEEFSIGAGKMYVYSGREVNDANALGKTTGYFTTNGPENLISKADDGSLIVKFKGASATTLKGFAISVTPVASVPMDVASVAVSDASADPVVRGASDAPVAHVAVTAEGTSGRLEIAGMKAGFGGSTNVADIAAARVYYTGKNATFSPVNPVSAKVSGFADGTAVLTFEPAVTIDESGTYHFWIAADLSNTTVPGNVADVTLTEIMANGSPLGITVNNHAVRTIMAGLGGEYRVGPSDEAAYATLKDAVSALALGVEDVVTFLIEDGTYPENIAITDITGTSEAHPVIFTSLSGNRDAVRITGSSILDKQGVVCVDNSSFIRFSNLTVAAPVPASEYSVKPFAAVHFRNGSRHCLLDNCVVTAAPVTSNASDGTVLVRTQDGSEENTNCDYLTVRDCYFDGGYISLHLGGTSYVARAKDTGLSVTGNTIANPYAKAVYLSDCADFTLDRNVVTAGTSLKKGAYIFDIYRPVGAFTVTANRVYSSQTLDHTGICFRSGGGSASAEAPAVIANNVVSLAGASAGYTYGVMLECSMTNVIFAHNTVSVKGDSALKNAYALAFSGKAPEGTAPQIVNNIVQNTTASGPLRPWDATHYANLAFSGNVYFGGAGVMDGDGNTIAQYAEATGDNTSVWEQARFLSDTDLHLLEAGDAMSMPRTAHVTVDADGNGRGESTTPGAYEYAPVSAETPAIEDGYPVTGAVADNKASVITRWTVGGALHALCVETSAGAPAREALLEAASQAAEAGADVTVTFRNLAQLTEYKAYFLMVSALGEESAIVESAPFTTAETILPLGVEIQWDEEPVEENATITLQAMVDGGKAPYVYEWTDMMNEPAGSDEVMTARTVSNNTYRLKVTSADGQTAIAKAHVPVNTASLHIATFEDLPLEAESSWKWDEDLDSDVMTDAFFSGSFRFGNFPMKDYDAWSGYAYANETSTAFNGLDDQFRNIAGGGAAGTPNYGVCFMFGADTRIDISSDEATVVPGMYVTNSAYTVNSILHGDAFADAFTAANGDYLTLVITGLEADRTTPTGTVEVSLADFRTATAAAGESSDGNVLTQWKWVDLTPLGAVKALKLSHQSSKYYEVPAYVCVDQIGAANPSSSVDGVESDIRVTVDNGIGCLTVSGAEGPCTLRVYSVDGVLRAFHSLGGDSAVSVAELSAGTYIAELITDGGLRVTHRFVIR